jgi:hypothetical protein
VEPSRIALLCHPPFVTSTISWSHGVANNPPNAGSEEYSTTKMVENSLVNADANDSFF